MPFSYKFNLKWMFLSQEQTSLFLVIIISDKKFITSIETSEVFVTLVGCKRKIVSSQLVTDSVMISSLQDLQNCSQSKALIFFKVILQWRTQNWYFLSTIIAHKNSEKNVINKMRNDNSTVKMRNDPLII